MNKIKFNQNLLFKIFAAIALTTGLALVAVGFFSFRFTASALQNFIMEVELEITQHTMNKIDRLLYERYSDILTIAGETAFEHYLIDLGKGAITSDQHNLRRIQDLSIVTGPWNTLFVVDSQGTIRLSTLDGEAGQPLSRWYYKQLAFERAMQGEANYSDFVILVRTGEPTVVFAAPIRDRNDPLKPVIGAVVADLSWMAVSQILDDVPEDNVLLLNQAGDIIANNTKYATQGITLPDAPRKMLLNKLSNKHSKSIILQAHEGIFSEETLVCLARQKGYLSYKGSGWNLILYLPGKTAFAPANQAALKVILIALPIILFMSGWILLIVHRVIVDPIGQLTKTIREITTGDLNKRALVTANDEIGLLAQAFNDMTIELRTSYEGLEEKIRQRTSELNKTIGELEKAQADIKQAELQLLQSEKLASIGQLAAGVAHEINNPVGFISNNMEILQQYIQSYTKILAMMDSLKKEIEAGDIEKTKVTLNEIKKFEKEVDLEYIRKDVNGLMEQTRRGLERINKIVTDLRTFAREDRGETAELVKIEEIIDSILSIVHSEVKYKADLTKEYGETPLIKCNVQRIGQVFINLLVNAAQAIEQRGTITIKTYTENNHVCIDVTDTGKGIAEENIKKIFDPFFTTKPVGQGTGLGLSVSYEIIKKHKGEIKVQSEVGKGSTFTVMIPINHL